VAGGWERTGAGLQGLREQEEKARENCPELAHRLAALVDSGRVRDGFVGGSPQRSGMQAARDVRRKPLMQDRKGWMPSAESSVREVEANSVQCRWEVGNSGPVQ
jgi:hypothetical protein